MCTLCLLLFKSRQVQLPTQMSQSEQLNLTEINGATTEHKCEGFWPRHLGMLQPTVQSRGEPKTGRNAIPRPRLWSWVWEYKLTRLVQVFIRTLRTSSKKAGEKIFHYLGIHSFITLELLFVSLFHCLKFFSSISFHMRFGCLYNVIYIA